MPDTKPSPDQFAIAEGRAFPWHECYVPDVDKAVDFYTNALGMGTQKMEMPGMPPYTMLTHNGQAVCGVASTDAPHTQGTPPHWAVYMSVDDVDARLEKVTSMGGKVVVPAMDIPTVGRMALIADPQGAHLWLFKPAPM
jgi:predicted enzyme related to lactoylglutathione lyase